MKSKKHLWIFLFLLLGLSPFFACQPTETTTDPTSSDSANIPVVGDWVRLWLPSEPDNLNPVCHLSATGTYVIEPMFLTLYSFDTKTLESMPCLAKGPATISEDRMSFTFEIRPEAMWDNGTPITGNDFAFSIKAIFNPLVEPAVRRLYYNFLSDVQVDPANPKKFTVSVNKEFYLAETSIAGIDIMPQHFYDPQGLMNHISVTEILKDPDAFKGDPKVKEFAEKFNSDLHGRDPAGIQGSGAYQLEEWITGDHITLVRKKDWWGDKLMADLPVFANYPAKLIYKVIPDRKTAVAALKSGELDVMGGVGEKEYLELKDGGLPDYHFYAPDAFAYSYIAMNTKPIPGRKKILTDLAVRKALAHLVDVDKMIKEIYYGFGQRTVGPVLPINGELYNSNLKPIEYNPELSKKLLADAGWKDTNGDGTLDKVIDGKRTEFVLEFMISEGGNRAVDMVQLVKDECAKVGIKIEGVARPLDKCQELSHEHQFDLFGISNLGHHLAPDLEQNWSTEQWVQKGSNITGFGNAETDAVLAQIRVEKDPAKRKALYHQIQQMIYDEQPAIFIRMPTERIAIHKRFRNAEPTKLKPGYKAFEFWVPVAEQKFK
jgi:peptide/nickel transport system substrate-binding protein